MSLYNQIMGYDEVAPIVLRLLGLDHRQVPRFRDASVIDVHGDARMVVLTRTGGGNREAYAAENEAMRQVRGFIRDYDAPEDTTFALFEYAPINETMRNLIRGMAKQPHEVLLTHFHDLIFRMGDPAHVNDPDVKAAVVKGKSILAPLLEQLDSHAP